MTLAEKYQVIVVGGGPVGLGLACDLGLRGVQCLLVEQTDGKIVHSKMNEVNTRTMEFTRRWGIADEVMHCPFPDDYPADVVFLTSLTGREIYRLRRPPRADRKPEPTSPMARQTCSQVWFDPMLAARTQSLPSVTIAYRHRLKGFEDGAAVSAEIEDIAAGETHRVEADYLVGCDGSRSIVREKLGIELEGKRRLGYSLAAFFIAPNLLDDSTVDPATFYMCVDETGVWGHVRAIDPRRSLWRFGRRLEAAKEPSQAELGGYIAKAFGSDYPVEFVDVNLWALNALVAESYGKGHVFLAGDAVHQLSQSGALGMNTGLADAMDLSWKLDAVLRGWGGPKLLDSYTEERRGVGWRNVTLATQLAQNRALAGRRHLDEDGAEGETDRREAAESIDRNLAHTWRRTGMELGYRYDESPIVIPDGSPPTSDDPEIYVPTARPGSRAPHAWLADGRSTLDLFGSSFVLLDCGAADGAARALADAAKDRAMPLAIEAIGDPDIAALYEAPLVLVRPDGHVAWRGDHADDPVAIVDRVRGAV